MKTPSNTAEFLEALKAARRLPSDYALAKHYGINTQTVSSYRTGRTVPDDAMGVKIAAALDLDPGYVLAQLAAERAERAKNGALANTWHDIARRFGIAAGLVVVWSLAPVLLSNFDTATASGAFNSSIHYTQFLTTAALQFALLLLAFIWAFDER